MLYFDKAILLTLLTWPIKLNDILISGLCASEYVGACMHTSVKVVCPFKSLFTSVGTTIGQGIIRVIVVLVVVVVIFLEDF